MNQQTNITGILERFEEEFCHNDDKNWLGNIENGDEYAKDIKAFIKENLTTLIDSIPKNNRDIKNLKKEELPYGCCGDIDTEARAFNDAIDQVLRILNI